MLAASCAGCDRPGELLCASCRTALESRPVDLMTPQGLRVRAALTFDGVAARCIRRLKGEGETLLARPLGAALRTVLASRSGSGGRSATLVPVPTGLAAFRSRGYRVPDLLIRRAGHRPRILLSVHGVRQDQRGLGIQGRADNVRRTMSARRVSDSGEVVLVDDVVTTGATLDEAARALTAAGYRVLSGVTLAATPRGR